MPRHPGPEASRAGRPLAGLLVVDLTRVLAGPFATMMMADLGARVIKVEHPATGDDSRRYGPFAADGRSMYFARVNRGKQSLAVDLKHDAAQVAKLAEHADVLVENFRPGVMDRLGLGAKELMARNPRLVYASVSGYGATGPRAGEPAYDAVIQARSGLMSVTGEPGGPPVKAGTSVSDLTAGVYTFGAVMAALVSRGIHGRGTHVDVSMFDATLSFLEGSALAYLADRTVPHRIGSHHPNIAPFGAFDTADQPDRHLRRQRRPVRLPGRDPRRPRPRHPARSSPTTPPARPTGPAHRRPGGGPGPRHRRTWLDRLEAAGIPCAPVNDIEQALEDPQTRARAMRITAGGLELPGQVVKMSGWPDPTAAPPRPAWTNTATASAPSSGSDPRRP